ncbi:glycosyl transferase [Arenicella chitinivorans]|uniref:Glycosyl transferase n=1 Tax=Arenicella chitinivorans TaxID=1329800 RepID=A0A918RMK4_9GAMM|nr:glycosyltransferase family 4 protein [Arenicella chitinivorans]GHA04398.1 glycosyl transferase [Arenicella chitinivorans]
MKILLLQSSVYYPSLGGGNKANRYLLEALAARGHQCVSIAKSLDSQRISDTRSEVEVLSDRGIRFNETNPYIRAYTLNSVLVQTVQTHHSSGRLARVITDQHTTLAPDVILVSDDKSGELLEIALTLNADRTVLLLHTNLHLPFGAEATHADADRAAVYARCRHRLSATRYTQEYLRQEGALASEFIPFPVFGSGSFSNIADPHRKTVGLINPCDVKGLSIFLALAERFPELEFVAVPTWGASQDNLARISALPNTRVVAPEDEINHILTQLSVLLVPSLIAETFGYVTVEAMLRGIPVLASDYGGLRDAKLGVPHLIPISPATHADGRHHIPRQNIEPWATALASLMRNANAYETCSRQSHQAAHAYIKQIDVQRFEHYFQEIAA